MNTDAYFVTWHRLSGLLLKKLIVEVIECCFAFCIKSSMCPGNFAKLTKRQFCQRFVVVFGSSITPKRMERSVRLSNR